MEDEQVEVEQSRRPQGARTLAWLNLRTRWVQVAIVLLAGILLVLVSYWILVPKPKPRSAVNTAAYRFVQCPKCDYETRYDDKLVGGPCPRCPDEPVGTLVGSEKSLKDLDRRSPYRWFYLAATIEAFGVLGAVVYLLSRPGPDLSNMYYVFHCPHCRQRLRFRHAALGGIGMCNRCKRGVRFPTEDEAVPEEEVLKAEQAAAAAEHEEEDD